MGEFPEKIWAIEKGYPSRYRVSCSVLEHGPDEATEYVRADLYAALEARLAERTGGVSAEDAREALRELANVKMDLSLEDWCRISNTILAALTTEPAAPEGRQDDDRIRREMDEILRKQSERDIPFAPSTRPAQQAVAEAMVEAAREIIHGARHVYSDEDLARAALKAAMEAGRHD